MSAQPEGTLPYPEPGGDVFTAGHAGSDASRDRALAEAEDGTATLRQQEALRLLALATYQGRTWREVSDLMGWHHGQASGVLSVLHKAGRIERLTERRNRSSVYVLPEYVNGRDTSPYRVKQQPVTVTHDLRVSKCECGSMFIAVVHLAEHVAEHHNNAPIRFAGA